MECDRLCVVIKTERAEEYEVAHLELSEEGHMHLQGFVCDNVPSIKDERDVFVDIEHDRNDVAIKREVEVGSTPQLKTTSKPFRPTFQEQSHNIGSIATDLDLATKSATRVKTFPTREIAHQPETRNGRRRVSKTDPTLKMAYQILTARASTTDPYLSFGRYIASELRKYDSRTLAFMKRAISNIIFEADLIMCADDNDDYIRRDRNVASSANTPKIPPIFPPTKTPPARSDRPLLIVGASQADMVFTPSNRVSDFSK